VVVVAIVVVVAVDMVVVLVVGGVIGSFEMFEPSGGYRTPMGSAAFSVRPGMMASSIFGTFFTAAKTESALGRVVFWLSKVCPSFASISEVTKRLPSAYTIVTWSRSSTPAA
jgi:hypothetical protein